MTTQMTATMMQSNNTVGMAIVTAPGFETYAKSINTVIAIVGVFVLSSVYAFLIERGARLSSLSRLPLYAIATNIESILDSHWNNDKNTNKIMYVGKQINDTNRKSLSPQDCTHELHPKNPTCRTWLTSGSSTTKNLVQIGIWEWTFLWVIVLMVISTLCYNGFFQSEQRPDATPRLVVTILYFVAYVLHAIFVYVNLTRFFVYISAGAAWSMLNRANFAVVDKKGVHYYIDKANAAFEEKTYDIGNAREQIGTPSTSEYRAEQEGKLWGTMYRRSESIKSNSSDIPLLQSNDQCSTDSDVFHIWKKDDAAKKREEENDKRLLVEAIKTINTVQEAERKVVIDSTKDALDKIISNGMIVVAILLSCGFTVWTDVPSSNLTTQIGSWGLLASLSIGMGLMFTSALQMSTAMQAFLEIFMLKELKINKLAIEHCEKRVIPESIISFTSDALSAARINWMDYFDVKNEWKKLLFFGPMGCLVPSSTDRSTGTANAEFSFVINVRDNVLLFTTNTNEQYKGETILVGKPKKNCCIIVRTIRSRCKTKDTKNLPFANMA